MQQKLHSPLKEWVPLGRAVFIWAFRERENAAPEAEKSFLDLTSDDIAELANRPLSKFEMEQLLKEKTGAIETQIDIENATFSFSFKLSSGAMTTGGPPWSLLRTGDSLPEPTEGVVEFSELMNSDTTKVGLTRIETPGPTFAKEIRFATGVVWRQFMLHAFDRAVASGDLLLYARPRNDSEAFSVLPTDLWPRLEVIDWGKGDAIAASGTAYWSIHAQLTPELKAEATSESKPLSEKKGWKRESAKRAIEALYGGQVPRELQNKVLCKEVNDWLSADERREPQVDNATILRAAGRRKH